MMVTVVALFAVCWAPFHIVHMMTEYSECLSFSSDTRSRLLPVRMDDESQKSVATHLGAPASVNRFSFLFSAAGDR